MYHHGADGSHHPGPGGLFGCERCDADTDELDDEPIDLSLTPMAYAVAMIDSDD